MDYVYLVQGVTVFSFVFIVSLIILFFNQVDAVSKRRNYKEELNRKKAGARPMLKLFI